MEVASGDGGDWDLLKEPPMKPTWEQIVAMQKESAALRAQAAAVLPAMPTTTASTTTPRARRTNSRTEYPLFIPSYRNPPLLSGNHHQQQDDDSFRARLRHGGGEIAPMESSGSRFVARHRHNLSMGLSPEMAGITPKSTMSGITPKSTMSGITPKSTMSGKSDGPVTPASLSTSTFLHEENPSRKQSMTTPGESSSRGGGGRPRAPAAAHSPTDDSLWKGCTGSLSMVTPLADAMNSGIMDMSRMAEEAQQTVSSESNKPRSQLFGFLPWGKKAPSHGGAQTAPLRREGDSSMKRLQAQLEQSERLRASEAGELQAMLKDMQAKFEQLHAHCRNLERRASKQSTQYHVDEDDSSSLESGAHGGWHRSIPHPSLTPELFMSTYDTAVMSLRRLSRAICLHIREMGVSASQVITTVLENHSIAKGRLRKAQKVLYFESFLNQIMFENFENASYEPSGGAPVLDPGALQQLSFQSFQELQTVMWDDVEQTVHEQGLIVNHQFHRFFNVRMEIVLNELGEVGDTETPASVISAFFDAVKAVWLLHHLAFSFRPAATILRVSQGAKFEPEFMEQVQESSDREARAKSVFLMINPGFLIDDWVVKCRVYCSRK